MTGDRYSFLGRACASFLGLALIVALWPALPAHADDPAECITAPVPPPQHRPVPEVVGPALFRSLIGWIALNTGYDVSTTYQTPPTLAFCDVGETIDYENQDLLVDASLMAVYDTKRRHIHLTRPWGVVNLVDQSVLLHELIHDVQLLNREWPCINAIEPEAYVLQYRWLQQHGLRPQLDMERIRRMAVCPPKPADQ